MMVKEVECGTCRGRGFVTKNDEDRRCHDCGGTGKKMKGKSEEKADDDRFVNK